MFIVNVKIRSFDITLRNIFINLHQFKLTNADCIHLKK